MVDGTAVNLSDLPALVARMAANGDKSFDVATVYAPAGTFGRSGLLFLKPEIASLDFPGLREAVKYLWQAAREYEIHIRTVHIISGRYALRRRFVQQNYSVIHGHALRMPGDDHPDQGRSLSSNSGWDWPMLGAMRALGPGRSATDLIGLWRASLGEIRKLDDDCYGLPIEAAGRKFVLLNGFYPFQLQAYAAPHSRIIALTFDTDRPLEGLKKEFQGDTDPQVASKGSVRSFLYEMTRRLGAPEIWISQNGLHMSANATKGVQELKVFESCFGDALRKESKK